MLRLLIFLAVIAAIFAIGEVLGASPDADRPMWTKAQIWACSPAAQAAYCSGGDRVACQLEDMRSETIEINFPDAAMIRQGSLGRSYVPIAGRYADPQTHHSILLIGRGDVATFHYLDGSAVLSRFTGAGMEMTFYDCAPNPG